MSKMDDILERAAVGAYGEDSDAIGKLAGIVRAMTFEQSFGPFICGVAGDDGYLICPTYGADAGETALYRRVTGNSGGSNKRSKD